MASYSPAGENHAAVRLGEQFYIDASRKPGPPEEFAAIDCTPNDLPTGLIVGSATITHCTKNCDGPPTYEWHLSDVKRLKKPRTVKGHPQPVWFRPFS